MIIEAQTINDKIGILITFKTFLELIKTFEKKLYFQPQLITFKLMKREEECDEFEERKSKNKFDANQPKEFS